VVARFLLANESKERHQMRRTTILGVWLLCASVSFACARANQSTAVTEVGCVTASGDRFVLTSLDSGERPATELYQLVGTSDELRPHVGREVLVTGEAQPARVAEVRETTPSTPVATSGSNAGAQPEVQTESQVRLETRQLRVLTVTPTGDDCAAGVSP
jgi:hypothetical protein